MRNHHEKIKDMAESVLPSTRRKGSRDQRRLIHQRERARVRACLHGVRQVAALGGDVDDADVDQADLFYEDKRAIQELVADRRSADKVGPLFRWAERKVQTDRSLQQQDWNGRMAIFRGMFTDNMIGRHALSHIEWAIGIPPRAQHQKIAR